jgi:glycosyltransferase involved in cell wall biosynthesis
MAEKMPNQPLVSLVITNYNYARFLRRAIDSALTQSYPAVEVVVVDDVSTDDSRAIIAEYGSRCVVVLRQKNGGNGACFNDGFAASHGAIVLFLDSDDALYPDAAASVVAAWRENTAKAQFYLDSVDATERPLGYCTPNIPFVAGEVLPLLRSYGYYPSPPTSGNAFARTVLARILPVPEAPWRMGLDGLLNAVAAFQGPVVSIHRSLGLYRYHDRNHSEVSGTNLQKIRRDLLNEANRELAVRGIAATLGQPIDHALSIRIPGHVKGRMASLKLDPAGHPFPDDTLWWLTARGIVASWRFPHHSFVKRLLATLGFIILPLVPAAWLAPRLDLIVVARKRSEWLRSIRRSVRSFLHKASIDPPPKLS